MSPNDQYTTPTHNQVAKTGDTRISALPHHIREAAKAHDIDGDGALDAQEIANAIGDLLAKKKENKNLKTLVGAFLVMLVLLIGAIFGASITAARLSQELTVGSDNGFAYVKGSATQQVLKTAEAVDYDPLKFQHFTPGILKHMKEIVLADGDLRFVVKGHARTEDRVRFLVEGGTLVFDETGLVDATGDARVLLEDLYGPAEELIDGDGRRRLQWWNPIEAVAQATSDALDWAFGTSGADGEEEAEVRASSHQC